MTHALAHSPSLPGGIAGPIPALWGVADVREARPELTVRQAWEVLKLAASEQDTRIGVTWGLLMHAAGALFGPAVADDAMRINPGGFRPSRPSASGV